MHFTRSAIIITIVAGIIGTVSPVAATVDTYLDYHIAYRHPQTDDICIGEHRMYASLGIPAASMMEASLAPALVYNQGGGHIDINELTAGAPMVGAYVSDYVTSGGIWEYSMTLDVSARAAQNGTTVAGRQATIDTVKMFLVAMGENLDNYVPGAWRLSVQVIGLPSQTGLSGTSVYATTLWPYTASSTLLAAYRADVINVDGTCP